MTWRVIPGFPDYEISDTSEIRKGTRVLKQTPDANYLGVKVKHESGVWMRVKVHVLMMATFVGPRPHGLVINHIDGNKHNNLLQNLEYCTHLENERHSLRVLNKVHLRDKHGKFCSSTSK